MAATSPLTSSKVLDVAKTVGLNVDQLKKDMESGSTVYKQQIEANYALAQSIGIVGTPSYIVATWTPTAEAKNVAFVPGMVEEEALQKDITQASK
jgi:protein-disulfide isomerase